MSFVLHLRRGRRTCPWMSPQSVTGASTRCTFPSSTKISVALAHSCFTSPSSSASQLRNRSIHVSTSFMPCRMGDTSGHHECPRWWPPPPTHGDGEKELGLDKVGRGWRGEAHHGRRDTTTKHQTCVGREWGGTRRARVHTTPSAMRRWVRDGTGAKRLLRGGDGTNRTEINASTPSTPTLRPPPPRWRPVPWEDQTSHTLGQRCTNERGCDGKRTNAQGHFNPTEKMGKHSFAPMRRMDHGQHQLNAFGFANLKPRHTQGQPL